MYEDLLLFAKVKASKLDSGAVFTVPDLFNPELWGKLNRIEASTLGRNFYDYVVHGGGSWWITPLNKDAHHRQNYKRV